MAEPGFSAIKAVKAGKVYQVDETIVSRPTLGLLKGIYRIGCLLYPDIYYCSAGKAPINHNGIWQAFNHGNQNDNQP
jgi:hypothetical protein